MKKHVLLVLIIQITFVLHLEAQCDYGLLFGKAQEAYNSKDFEKALSQYQAIKNTCIGLDSARIRELDAWIAKTEEAIHSEDPFAGQMVEIPAGIFTMGSPTTEAERQPEERQHSVSLDAFRMGKYEVTQAQWQKIMGDNPSFFKDCPDCPVERVSWDHIQGFLKKLNQETGKKYRLPTEAEWEYACRAGSTGSFNTGGNLTTGQANYNGNYPYNDNAKGVYWKKTKPVGSFTPNKWGLYDMHGNVWEWCSDWYGSDYYLNSPILNPIGPGSGTGRVLRGGGWNGTAKDCRSAYRYGYSPSNLSYYGNGFRVVL